MATEDIINFLPLVLESGKIALNWQNRLERSFKADRTIVTQADKEVEDLIVGDIKSRNPAYQVLGEETSGVQSREFFRYAFNGTCFVVDPIDGTAPYANGLPTWGVSLGVMDDGFLTQGIIYLAALGEMFFTHEGKSWMARVSDPAGNPVLGEKILLPPAPRFLAPGQMVALSQRLARTGTNKLDHPFQMTGSSVFALAKIAQGCYGAYTAQLCLWDFAAGLPLLRNLGYTTETKKIPGPPPGLSELLKGPSSDSPWCTRDTLLFGPPGVIPLLRDGIDEEL